MAAQSPSETWSFMGLVSELGNATKSKDPARIRVAKQALNTARVEREIVQNLSQEHGIPEEERKRLAALLLDGQSAR